MVNWVPTWAPLPKSTADTPGVSSAAADRFEMIGTAYKLDVKKTLTVTNVAALPKDIFIPPRDSDARRCTHPVIVARNRGDLRQESINRRVAILTLPIQKVARPGSRIIHLA